MDKICIATVFAKSPYNQKWSDLQSSFIKRTTSNYDLICCLNREPRKNINADYTVIHQNNKDLQNIVQTRSHDHCNSLKIVLNHFIDNKNNYDSFVILDSDAFPIRNNWYGSLKQKLNDYNKIAAATVRLENLTTFPHPCVMVLKKEALDASWLHFKVEKTTDILGGTINDTCCGLPLNKFFPLIRTNVWNPHPLLFGIYSHLFYHHGCGSRNARFHSQKYYGMRSPDQKEIDKMQAEFFRTPRKFIDKLVGKIPYNNV